MWQEGGDSSDPPVQVMFGLRKSGKRRAKAPPRGRLWSQTGAERRGAATVMGGGAAASAAAAAATAAAAAVRANSVAQTLFSGMSFRPHPPHPLPDRLLIPPPPERDRAKSPLYLARSPLQQGPVTRVNKGNRHSAQVQLHIRFTKCQTDEGSGGGGEEGGGLKG